MASNPPHVVAIPFPMQGHINPMLQFCKILAFYGIHITFVTKSSTTIAPQIDSNMIKFETIPDEEIESEKCTDYFDARHQSLKASILKHLPKIIQRGSDAGDPVKVLVYDSLMPWCIDVGRQFELRTAALFTQSCAVNAIYYHLYKGTLDVPLPFNPDLEPKDFPSLVKDNGSYPSILRVVLNQNSNFGSVDWLLFNTFFDLEREAIAWMETQYPIKTIGPMIPSMYLDNRMIDDKHYGLNIFNPNSESLLNWLDSKPNGTVVYVSFGSLADLKEEQMEEIARGLGKSGCYFLWVVRDSEKLKLPRDFVSGIEEKGLIVNWCHQLEVLTHKALGSFVTHCGWNSTLEALSLGVPMIVMPLWTDQTTNAKYIVDVWKTGVRVEAGDDGIIRRDEIENRVREVMHTGKANELKKNALKFMDLARTAMSKGGSSDDNIQELVSSILVS